jgi:hypothetical protein
MKQLNQERVKQLANRECILKNENGSLEELREIIKAAFPDDEDIPIGKGNFYYASILKNSWVVAYEVLPFEAHIYTIADFYEEEKKEEWQPVFGEWVEVRDFDTEEWVKAIYLNTIKQAFYPYTTVTRLYENDFSEGKLFGTTNWRQIRRIQQPEKKVIKASLQQIAEMLNVDEVVIE